MHAIAVSILLLIGATEDKPLDELSHSLFAQPRAARAAACLQARSNPEHRRACRSWPRPSGTDDNVPRLARRRGAATKRGPPGPAVTLPHGSSASSNPSLRKRFVAACPGYNQPPGRPRVPAAAPARRVTAVLPVRHRRAPSPASPRPPRTHAQTQELVVFQAGAGAPDGESRARAARGPRELTASSRGRARSAGPGPAPAPPARRPAPGARSGRAAVEMGWGEGGGRGRRAGPGPGPGPGWGAGVRGGARARGGPGEGEEAR